MLRSEHPLYLAQLQALVEEENLPWETLRGIRILITGATGMLGSCLVDLLMEANRLKQLGISVYAMGRSRQRGKARFAKNWEDPLFCFIEQDLCEKTWKPLEPVTYIVHAASNADPISFARFPVETLQANLWATEQLLTLAKEWKHCRLLFVSSGEMYGQMPPGSGPMIETDCGTIDHSSARSCYPVGKRAAEVLCQCFLNEYGVDSVIARPCHLYGPTMTDTDSRAIAQFVRNAVDKQPIVMKSKGEQDRTWCYVTDAACGLLYILLRGQRGQAYNVADLQSRATVRSIAEQTAQAGGTEVVFALPSETEKAGYTPITHAVLDPGKLQSLGWKARVPLAAGLATTIQVLREEKDA